jgi:RNA polymerase sporulation-specific sigma factor
MSRILNTPILSAQEELEYAKLAAAGDVVARNKLIVSNIPFVAFCARAFRGYGLSTEDLISEGTLGLMKAIDRFDYTRGGRLITYAKSWICMYMQKAVKQRSRKKYQLVSLDATFDSDGKEETFGAGLADTENLSVEEDCENKIVKEKLLRELSALKPNEREILTLHYGLGNQEEHSFEQIGVMKGRSRARMQQIEKKAFVYLRQKLEHYIS